MGTASNATYHNLWQTAASEGIAVFVPSGDQGSAACDLGDQTALTLAVADYGLAVNGLASTPYNTAVGGTDFNWCKPTDATNCTTAAPYWSSTNNATTGASALGYVPEVPWSDTCSSPQSVAYLATIAQFIGASAVADAETACNFVVNNYKTIYKNFGHADLSGSVNVLGGSGGASNCSTNTTLVTPSTVTLGTCTSRYAKPSWQAGVPGIPADGQRDIPDVSFFAADGLWNSAYLICASAAGNACTGTNTPSEVGVHRFRRLPWLA
jgi:subtilase family serine protease